MINVVLSKHCIEKAKEYRLFNPEHDIKQAYLTALPIRPSIGKYFKYEGKRYVKSKHFTFCVKDLPDAELIVTFWRNNGPHTMDHAEKIRLVADNSGDSGDSATS
jgi:hypothetical protein